MSSNDAIHMQSFSILPAYLYNLKIANRDTRTSLQTDANGCFRFCFVALGCVVNTFTVCLLPVLYVDCIPLQGMHVRAMFVAVAVDGNRDPLPIAFGFSHAGSGRSWRRFLTFLKEHVHHVNEVSFISKVSNTIPAAIASVYPGAYHGYCLKNVANRVCGMQRGNPHIHAMFWRACKCYTEPLFDEYLAFFYSKLETLRLTEIRDFLNRLGKEKWASVFFPKKRFHLNSVTVPDFINYMKRDVRDFPITNLIDHSRLSTETLFTARREFAGTDTYICLYGTTLCVYVCVHCLRAAGQLTGAVTPYVQFKIQRRVERFGDLEITTIDENSFSIFDFGVDCRVNLQEKSCTCLKWQNSGLPCHHALLASQSVPNTDLLLMMRKEFSALYYRTAYLNHMVHPLPPPAQWEMPSELPIVLPPTLST